MEHAKGSIVTFKNKKWKIVEILPNDRFKLKCMVCGSKYEIVGKDQL